ncbi:YbfB/YjiJ family MFS transporter [Comamonadaceae bacterium SL12-8]|uniref:YbfB/YjiJ family MFS transporter n=2 Tax=Amphibiibacter pelophylacis TaxID=1799477 RepID=A0ACC6P5D7_9BURK
MTLSLGAAVSLGITRFAYSLLLPPMRADLGWSYTVAGAMNTANALGYLLGALLTPRLLRRCTADQALLGCALLASAVMALGAVLTDTPLLLAQRLLAGVVSAVIFMTGGLLAAQLGALSPSRSGLLLGLVYGGVGWGIALSSGLVPPVLEAAQGVAHSWRWAWAALGVACLLASLGLWAGVRWLRRWQALAPRQSAQQAGLDRVAVFRWRDFVPALAGYLCFGMGYIGYMTFVIALLRQEGASGAQTSFFFALLGLAVVGSGRLWAGLLDRWKGGQPMAVLNALLGVATLLPVLTQVWPVMLLSGIAFGAVFLSVVASTTALVRHNLAPGAWMAGIGAFTLIFAAGQVIGPTLTGMVSDGAGGLRLGLLFSALTLWAGAALALLQKPLAQPATSSNPKG